MKTPMKRWVCPTCSGGINAPSRPRKDDVRRYCLPCSAKTGRLVERSCPSLERVRAIKTEKTTAQRLAKQKEERAAARAERERRAARIKKWTEQAEREALERRTALGVDLLVEAERLWNLPYIKQQPSWRPKLPTFEFHRSEHKVHTSGHCWGHGSRARITVTIGRDECEAFAALLHEIIHAVMPNGEHHGERFWMTLRSASREAWPDAPFRFNLPASTKWERQLQIVQGLRAMSAVDQAAMPIPAVKP